MMIARSPITIMLLLVVLATTIFPITQAGCLSVGWPGPCCLMTGTELQTPVFVKDSGRTGATVMVIAGIHGNEPGGVKAAENLLNYRPGKGRLIVVPYANKPACEHGLRTMAHMQDLNREFPGKYDGKMIQRLAWEITELMRTCQPDLVLDLHEAADKYDEESGVPGQTLIINSADDLPKLVLDVIDKLNGSLAEGTGFTILAGAPGGSINRETGEILGIPVITVETSMKQDLQERVRQQEKVISLLLECFEMGWWYYD